MSVTDNPITLVGALVAGLGTLCTVVGVLWRYGTKQNSLVIEKLEAMNNRIEKELEECKEDRKKIWDEIRALQCGGKGDIFG